jgi:putative membrane protein
MKTRQDSFYRTVEAASRNDLLAVIRTQLANERTGLAYARTALVLFATGLSFIKLFPEDGTMQSLAAVLIPLAAIAAVAGGWSFVAAKRRIAATNWDRSGGNGNGSLNNN